MTSLVTGATGFIGQHLVASLIADRTTVVALCHNTLPPQSWYGFALWPGSAAVQGDVRDLLFLRQVLSRYEVDTVYHLAAQTQVGISASNPADTFDVNVRGTWTVLEACRLEKVRRVVVASSDKAYGECKDSNEGDYLRGMCAYSVSKVCADRLATSYGVTYDLPVAITRCGNVYGPGDTHWRRLIPGAIRAALRGEPFQLRTDGSGVRDYLHVSDVVRAYRMLADSKEVGPFNFSGGWPSSARGVLNFVWQRIGDAGKIVYGDSQDELKLQTLCCRKALKMLGWTPKVDFDRGLDDTIRWYREHLR